MYFYSLSMIILILNKTNFSLEQFERIKPACSLEPDFQLQPERGYWMSLVNGIFLQGEKHMKDTTLCRTQAAISMRRESKKSRWWPKLCSESPALFNGCHDKGCSLIITEQQICQEIYLDEMRHMVRLMQ